MSLLQNNYLQYIIRGYKRIFKAAFEREVAILLLNLYIKVMVLQRVAKVGNYPIKRDIKIVVNNIWETT